MKRLIFILSLTALLLFGLVPTNSTAISSYAGPCSMASDLGYQSPMWNATCYDYMEAVDECCASGECEDWICSTL
jgi:hypothetical protein